MGFRTVCLPQPGLASCSRAAPTPTALHSTCTYGARRSTFGSPCSLLIPRSVASYQCRRSASVTRQNKLHPAAWAGNFQNAAFYNFDVEDQLEGNSTFKQLCHSQSQLVCTVLRQTGGSCGARITVYRREPATFEAGQLQLSKVTSYTDLDSQHPLDDLDGTLSLGQVANGAEKALADAQLVDLPNTGAFALPLAAHGFLVGLLVLEQIVWPKPALCTNMMQTGHMAASRRDAQDEGSNVVLGEQDRQVVQLAGQVLAAACAMDLHSALQTAQASMHSQHVIGLVEEVRGPLTALRTLGSILVPRLRQKEGQEIDRDVAQGILTQGDRLQEVVGQLQAAIHPAALPPGLGSFQRPPVGTMSTAKSVSKRMRNKKNQAQPLLPRVKQDSSADDQLHN
ncbi:hypothetical protein ABBQ38_001312 [Trebouxia sp. C0009 RCD-2024]